MLEKDKNCIEFSMRSMMATHKPYQEDTEITITGMAPGKSLLLANNPFDIPCDVVVVSKRYFERLQTENEKLKKKLAVPDPLPEFRELLEKLYSKDDAENLEWALNHTVGGRGSVNGWRAVSSFWSEKYKKLSKLVGFSSVEKIEDYLTNEVECDTLHEAILKLIDENKYACDEWYSANSQNNSWKAAAECNSPKELIEKREALEKEIDVYSRNIIEWKEATGCPSPSSAKNVIDSTESWHQAYRDVKATNEKLADNVKSWRKATGYSTPEEYLADRINGAFQTPFDYTAAWQKATGFESPEKFLKWKTHIEEIMKAWKDRTGCKYPGEAGELLERWKTLTKCETPEAAATWITSYESACGRGNRLAESVEKLKEEVVSWKNVTGYSTPEGFLYAMTKDSDNVWRDSTECKTLVDIINGLDQEIDKWQKATGYNSPEEAKTFIKNLNDRLGGFIQAASCAERHLEHVLLWKPEQTGQEVE